MTRGNGEMAEHDTGDAGLVKVRRLREGDLSNGFLEALDALRPASDLSLELARDVFRRLERNPDCVVAVAEVGERIVGAATLLVEHKFINQAGKAGHIEDVAVAVEQQGRGIGRALIRYLLQRAAEAGCYKTILDCADDVRPFYEGLGFRRSANGMDFRHR
jgi:glucosamine-phosphate N-acetyltransferase